MAIHPDYPGLTVDIAVNDTALPEFHDEDASAQNGQVVTYVEAQSGAEFSIRYNFARPFPCDRDIKLQMFVDGNKIRAAFFRKYEIYGRICITRSVRVEKNGLKWIHKSLRFNDLIIDQQKNEEIDEEAFKKLRDTGTIKLMFQFGKATKSMNEARTREISTLGPVTEEALKGDAKGLQAGYGSQKLMSAPTIYHFDADGEVFATFIFKYRSRANLEALHIIPRSSSPSTVLEQKPDIPLTESSSPPSTPAGEKLVVRTTSPRVLNVEPHQNRMSIKPDPEPPNAAQTCTPRRNTPIRSIQPLSSSSAPALYSERDELTTEEIIIMIVEHRGHDKGLADKSKRSLLALLKFYEGKDTEVTPLGQTSVDNGAANEHVKYEPVERDGRPIRIKREGDGNDSLRSNKKRQKKEIIVLDD